MEKVEKINVRGAINALRVRQTLTLARGVYKPSTVRQTASAIKADTGKCFSIRMDEGMINVKRRS
jgi:hypothetical protein